jgi:aminoglycoside phosphotransferase (APT) family kinase protein
MSCGFAHPTPEFVCFVKGHNSEPIGMIETALAGVSLDRFKDRSTLKRISHVAANVHGVDTGLFNHLPNRNTRTQHIQSRLDEIDGDLFAEFPLADQARDWIANYLPSDDQTCVLHGDLLPQNLLHDWQSTSDSEGVVAVVDWETARQPERNPANPEVCVMQVCVKAATQQSLRVSMKITEVIFVLKRPRRDLRPG